jgi:CubicO group peptidase (beta-lactamase class C family)
MMIADRVHLLDLYLEKAIEDGAFPGAVWGLITPDEEHFGFAGHAQILPGPREMRSDSIFDIASLTKVVATTTSIMILIENGELRLHDAVGSILPAEHLKNTTILQLLTHTSGLPASVKFYQTNHDRAGVTKDLYQVPLVNEPGTVVTYSDLNFMLLGLVIEKLSGSLEHFAHQYIFEPLDMNETCFNPSAERSERFVATEFREDRGFVSGEVHDGNAYAMGGVSGHAGLFSTVQDLGRFVRMVLNNGYHEGRKIISVASLDLMRHCYTEQLTERRGLGWKLKNPGDAMGDLASEDALFHTGFTGTSLLVDQQRGLGVILLTNRIHPSRDNQKLLALRGSIHNIAETVID